jgi:hypothetical protein
MNALCRWKVSEQGILAGIISLWLNFFSQYTLQNQLRRIFTISIDIYSWRSLVWATDDPNRLHCFEVNRLDHLAGNQYSRSRKRGFGENSPNGKVEALWPATVSPSMKTRRLTYRSSKSAEPFSLGAISRDERYKNKLTAVVYVAPSWVDCWWLAVDKLYQDRCT